MEIFLLGLVAFAIMVLFGARVLAVLVLLPVVVWVMAVLFLVFDRSIQREPAATAKTVCLSWGPEQTLEGDPRVYQRCNLPAVEKPIPFRPIPPAWWSP